MSPNKSLAAQLDQIIETDIDQWCEERDREPEQTELDFDE